jgi:protein TonB
LSSAEEDPVSASFESPAVEGLSSIPTESQELSSLGGVEEIPSPEPPQKQWEEAPKTKAPQKITEKVRNKKRNAPSAIASPTKVKDATGTAPSTTQEKAVSAPPSSSASITEPSNAGTGVGEAGNAGSGTQTMEGARKGGRMGSAQQEFELAQVDRPPEIISRVEPHYPRTARSRRLSGKIVVKFLVDPQGRVEKQSILEANPQGVFESSVLEAVARWRFKPGYYKGQPVSTWIVVPLQFKLSG